VAKTLGNKIMESIDISLRDVDFEGVDKLWWLTVDQSAFNGPLSDWKSDKEVFLSYIKTKDVVIQAGGNCGMYARFYSNYFSEIYSFEPEKNNFKCLELNCKGSQFHLYNVGLGKSAGTASLKKSKQKPRNAGIWQTIEDPTGNINIITIDSLNLQKCNLIHLDVEGFESNVLLGAIETIEKYKPVIILEEGSGSKILDDFNYSVKFKGQKDWVLTYDK
jgi:FkbM family methyltransferase